MSTAWFCDLHRIRVSGDCPKCDDELIAMADADMGQSPSTDSDRLARAWNDGADAIREWIASNPGPSGVWSDPPNNPHESL
jgi:hypothetical protein